MIWTVSFIAAVIFFAAAITAAIVVREKKRMRSNRVITPFNILFVGVFLTTLALLIPVYCAICAEMRVSPLQIFFFTTQGTLQVFTVDADSSLILDNIPVASGGIAPVYSWILSVLFVVAPIFTFGFLISLFKNMSASIQFLLKRGRDAYVFSALNEKSLALATDILDNHPKAVVVFTGITENDEEDSVKLIGRARELGAICFERDILSVKLGVHDAAKTMAFFSIGEDESKSIGQALKLIERYGNVPHTHLYVFTTRVESELLLAHNRGIPMKVRRIDEVRSLVNGMLYERGQELFESALPTEDGQKKIHVALIGLGRHGTTMLKALSWYCQMTGYVVEIDAFDRDPLAEERFTALCPELMSEKYNGVVVEGEAQYTIRIHPGVDTETKTFADAITAMRDITFAFVSTGSDENNVKAAVDLRMLFERAHIKPRLYTVINSSEETAVLTNITNYRGQPYEITCVGDLRSLYSERVILKPELEEHALRRHLKWGEEEEFWQYEYNYRSSMASAIHMRARIACGIPGADKPEDQLTEEERRGIEVLEHRRWNAYMRSEGYVFSGSKEKSSRNDLGKMHHDLVDFSSLSEEDKRKDSSVGSL